MKGFAMAVVVSAALAAAGCARLQVYSDEAMTKKTGFKYYLTKPYLLVSLNNPEPGAVATSVVYLPDLSSPYWVDATPGLLSNSALKMEFSNSVMTSFGQDVTSNVTGLLDSYGNLAKALAEARKARAEGAVGTQSIPEADESTPVFFLLYEVVSGASGTSLKLVDPPRRKKPQK